MLPITARTARGTPTATPIMVGFGPAGSEMQADDVEGSGEVEAVAEVDEEDKDGLVAVLMDISVGFSVKPRF